ncbi:MAG: hypothetical protein JOZ82_08295 [Marmoricola sp.]|nr:hypothetical protein [Marmoricola sp.]
MSALTKPRPADGLRLTLGVVLVARPDLAVRWTDSPDGTGVRRTVRILGARYLLQSGVGLTVRRRWLRVADTGVDLIHALSMLGFARAFPDHRRMALTSAGAAVAFAALDAKEHVR